MNVGKETAFVWIWQIYIATFVVALSNKDVADLFKFTEFIKKYNRSYSPDNDVQFHYRFTVFKESLRRQDRLNAARQNDYDAWYGVTQFSDLTRQEFMDMYLTHIPATLSSHKSSASPHNNVYEFTRSNKAVSDITDLPKQFDWRKKGVIGAIRNQGSCGACWAFSVVETAASVLAIQNGAAVIPLSSQQLVDCAWKNNGCKGGDTCRALDWLVQEDVPMVTEKEYPYKDMTQSCGISPTIGAHVSNYTCQNLEKSEDQMISELVSSGPLAVAVDANTWRDYMGGIIQYHCGVFINHAVQIVGYDIKGPVPHYIVRNQWGTGWGLNGYLLVKAGDNMCQIAKQVASIKMK